MFQNGRHRRARAKNELYLGKESDLAKSASWKPSEFSEDLSGKFNVSRKRRTMALDW